MERGLEKEGWWQARRDGVRGEWWSEARRQRAFLQGDGMPTLRSQMKNGERQIYVGVLISLSCREPNTQMHTAGMRGTTSTVCESAIMSSIPSETWQSYEEKSIRKKLLFHVSW